MDSGVGGDNLGYNGGNYLSNGLVEFNPLQQTDSRWPREEGVPRWGCAWKDHVAIPQFHLREVMTFEQEYRVYRCCWDRKILYKDKRWKDPRRFGMRDPTEVTNIAFMIMDHPELKLIHVGNEEPKYKNVGEHYRTHLYKTKLRKVGEWMVGGGPHWVLEDFEGFMIYNSDLSLSIQPTNHFLRYLVKERINIEDT